MSRNGRRQSHQVMIPRSWRDGLLLFLAAAFLLQSYITQTHIHFGPAPGAASAITQPDGDSITKVKPAGRSHSQGKLPGNDDPAKCPLCQAIGYAGQFVWPDAIAFVVLPQQAASIVQTLAAIASKPRADSYNWQGRAPPRA